MKNKNPKDEVDLIMKTCRQSFTDVHLRGLLRKCSLIFGYFKLKTCELPLYRLERSRRDQRHRLLTDQITALRARRVSNRASQPFPARDPLLLTPC